MAIVYFNGDLLNEDEVKVSVNDAGYYYGDGIYEVILYYKGKFIDKDAHLDRLVGCMQKVHFNNTPSKDEIFDNIKKVVLRNEEIFANNNSVSIYIQITRGCAIRSHTFGTLNLQPSVLIKPILCDVGNKMKQWSCNIVEDPRRMHREIKMTSLMPMVIAKYESEKAGYDDVIFYNSNVNSITEGSSFNVFIVSKDNEIITCPNGKEILPGCTRARVIDLLKKRGLKVIERFYSKEQLFDAKEVFATAALKPVASIIKVDDKPIFDGKVGEITALAYDDYMRYCENL